MHSRNIYRDRAKTDFVRLADSYPPLSAYLIHSSSIDFRDHKALLALTQAFLYRDFNLKLTMPQEDRLIPPVPQKLNYILWLEDLLQYGSSNECGHSVRGIDIGTGASCVYPLIGARKNGWKFVATEIDELSKEYAQRNVTDNKLNHLIQVILVGREDVLCGVVGEESDFDFCMCNPPFFGSEDETLGRGSSRTDRRPQAKTSCTGMEKEIVTEGGELKFVQSIVNDSIKIQTRIRWYTSMLGKKSSVKPLVEELQCQGIKVTTTTFIQGKTHRWAIAWTFHKSIEFPIEIKSVRKRSAHRPLSFSIMAGNMSIGDFTQHLLAILEDLQISTTPDMPHMDKEDGMTFMCSAHRNTWIHSRRKRRAMMNSISKDPELDCQQLSTASYEKEQPEIPNILKCQVTVKLVDSLAKKYVGLKHNTLCVEMEWIDGENRDLMNQLLLYLRNQITKQIRL